MNSADKRRLDALAYRLAHDLFGSECVLASQFHPGKFTGPVQAAHVIPKRHLSVRWNLENCLPLCPPCHYLYDKHRAEYVAAVRERVGEKVWEMLQAAKNGFAKGLCYEEMVLVITSQFEELRRERDFKEEKL
jgi:hypothetical protein